MGEDLENCAAPNVTGNECPFCGKNGTSGDISYFEFCCPSINNLTELPKPRVPIIPKGEKELIAGRS